MLCAATSSPHDDTTKVWFIPDVLIVLVMHMYLQAAAAAAASVLRQQSNVMRPPLPHVPPTARSLGGE